ncbi:Folylpolyglutamate synthetase [Trinorchestia longiramus]|nr:Folylpolyglutamate synthetase [Trinorchestia longiramus]
MSVIRTYLGYQLFPNPRNNAKDYHEAILALNGLQSNAATIQNIRQHGDTGRTQVPDTIKYLGRAGITLDMLDRLSVIHITGTKGKGSTCAFTERILRQYGYKTGLYTSPHLVSVTERIRINGLPIHCDEYTKHFWSVYNALYCKRESANDMPAYFKFLTVLAMKIFLEAQVDVAVLEVGIGGEYDCTNVVRNPVVCGITTLDLDHTSLLGNTLESIAWHKAGIIKSGAGVFTVQGHPPEAIKVIEERAAQKQCKVMVCPALEQYSSAVPVQLGLSGHVQLGNASLALQLARYWINNSNASHLAGGRVLASVPPAPAARSKGRCAPAFVLTDQETRALRDVVWPGRSQVFPVDKKLTFFLDGAHTNQSMEACTEWFLDASAARLPAHQRDKCVRVLWFNATGDRDIQTLLRRLLGCRFNLALFTTNMVSQDPKFADQINRTVSGRSVLLRCQTNLETWQFLTATRGGVLSQQSQGHRDQQSQGPRDPQSQGPRDQQSQGLLNQQSQGPRDQKETSSALDERPNTGAKASVSDDVSCSASLDCPNVSSDKSIPEICSVFGEDGVKSAVQDDRKPDMLNDSQVGNTSTISARNDRALDTVRSLKSKPLVGPTGNDVKTEAENFPHSSSLSNSKYSLESQTCDGCAGSLTIKNSPEKRRSSVLQENVLTSRETSDRERLSGRVSVKESKLDYKYNFSVTDRKSLCQSEIPVSKVDSEAGPVNSTSASAGRNIRRASSLPLDSCKRSPAKHTQSSSLDRTHMLQLVSADDPCDSANDVAVVIPYIQDALEWLRCGRHMRQTCQDLDKFPYKLSEDSSIQETLAKADHVHVLVTGSLHLVGGVLAALDPSLTNSVHQKQPTNQRRAFYSSPGTP